MAFYCFSHRIHFNFVFLKMISSENFMNRCFDLAKSGLGMVAPNPMVGVLLVHDKKIIGEGFHHEFGKAHAEVNAINDAEKNYPEKISSSELYVNLEPCSHYGKNPPCADLIIQRGIRKVFISNYDTNPLVAGKGIEKLRAAGIEVATDILSEEGRKLNKRFFTFHEQKRPFIILKWAQTPDGFIAPVTKERFQISGVQSQELVHKWRSEEQSVLVGTETALTDNPQLNVRFWSGKNPIRIVIDSKLLLPEILNLFNHEIQTIIFNSIKTEEQNNISFVKLNFKTSILNQLLSHLHSKNIQSIIIEGGTATLQKFIDENLWDEARIFTAPKKLVYGIKAPVLSIDNFNIENLFVGEDELKIINNFS